MKKVGSHLHAMHLLASSRCCCALASKFLSLVVRKHVASADHHSNCVDHLMIPRLHAKQPLFDLFCRQFIDKLAR